MSTYYLVSHLWGKQFWPIASSMFDMKQEDIFEFFLRSIIPASAFTEEGVDLNGEEAKLRLEKGGTDLLVSGSGYFETPLPRILKPIQALSLCGFNHIGDGIFGDCPFLSYVDLSLCELLDEIPPDCFRNAKSLKQISLPGAIKTIRRDAFYGCTGLDTIYLYGTRNQWNEVKIEREGNEALKNAIVLCFMNE